MKANDLIKKYVKPDFHELAHVRAYIVDKDTWQHVHKDEELPLDCEISVVIKLPWIGKNENRKAEKD